VEAVLEVRDLARVLAQQVLPELVAAVHLHREPAEVAEELLPVLQDRPPLSAKRAW
jgi:hypothetical protein